MSKENHQLRHHLGLARSLLKGDPPRPSNSIGKLILKMFP